MGEVPGLSLLLYLTSLRPNSIVEHNQENLNIGRLFSSLGSNALGYIHYSPKEEIEFSSIPANRMFVDENVSGDIFDYLTGLSDDVLGELLPSHGYEAGSIRESIQVLRNGDRKKFINIRHQNLIYGERQFMERRGVRLPEISTGDIIADSDTS